MTVSKSEMSYPCLDISSFSVSAAAQVTVGFSTGAVARGDVQRGIRIADRCTTSGPRLVELSALHADELDSVLAVVVNQDLLEGFDRVSIHAPTKGPTPPAELLVERLTQVNVDVVAHPDAMLEQCGGHLEVFARLGSQLLVENNDGRKDFGGTPGDLVWMFERLPEARMCLDVSHALHSGGTRRLDELADTFGDRIAQLHVGCACGDRVGVTFDKELLDAVAHTTERLGWAPPTVLERSSEHAPVEALVMQYNSVRNALI